MDFKKIMLEEFFERDDLNKEKTRNQYKMDKLEQEFVKTLSEEQIKTFEEFLELFVEIYSINEELLAEYLWNTIKQVYRQLLFC